MTESRSLQIAFGCLVLFAVMFATAAALDSQWLRVASLGVLIAAAMAYEIWLWWGAGRVWLAVSVGAVLTAIVAGFVAYQVT